MGTHDSSAAGDDRSDRGQPTENWQKSVETRLAGLENRMDTLQHSVDRILTLLTVPKASASVSSDPGTDEVDCQTEASEDSVDLDGVPAPSTRANILADEKRGSGIPVSSTTSSSSSVLCERCSVLDFDDSLYGFEAGTETGESYLATEHHHFPLDYFLVDSLPGLDVLRTSSGKGCRFCGLLLTALLEQNLECSGRLEATMRLLSPVWQYVGTDYYVGVSGLRVEVEITSSENQGMI